MNNKSIVAVDSARFSKYFAKPLYDTYSLKRYEESLTYIFGGMHE
ncbi:MAG: hypothetical protein P4L16_02460 [Chlamydiales bacterium]|nr:hypothetical protein [Chlamydiales bacterium]